MKVKDFLKSILDWGSSLFSLTSGFTGIALIYVSNWTSFDFVTTGLIVICLLLAMWFFNHAVDVRVRKILKEKN